MYRSQDTQQTSQTTTTTIQTNNNQDNSDNQSQEPTDQTTNQDKNILLQKLKQLGVHKSGRKVRTDAGQSHVCVTTRKPRSDKGQSHNYKYTAATYFAQFQEALKGTAIRNEYGEIVGEGATRDANDFFDVRITHRWKVITKQDGSTYKTKVRVKKPLEQYRWNWLRQLAIESGSPSQFCDKYFVKESEWDMWSFSEWVNAYMYMLNGDKNTENIKICYLTDDGKHVIYYPDYFSEHNYAADV